VGRLDAEMLGCLLDSPFTFEPQGADPPSKGQRHGSKRDLRTMLLAFALTSAEDEIFNDPALLPRLE
jgi:hypothetical protein